MTPQRKFAHFLVRWWSKIQSRSGFVIYFVVVIATSSQVSFFKTRGVISEQETRQQQKRRDFYLSETEVKTTTLSSILANKQIVFKKIWEIGSTRKLREFQVKLLIFSTHESSFQKVRINEHNSMNWKFNFYNFEPHFYNCIIFLE